MTILDDPDFVALMLKGTPGSCAFSIFIRLVLQAKKMKNGGRFVQPLHAIAPLVQSTTKEIDAACDLIAQVCKQNKSKPWIIRKKRGLHIRSFLVWNQENRGGHRPNAGRPKKSKQNQIDSDSISNTGPSVPVSVPVSAPVSVSRESEHEYETRALKDENELVSHSLENARGEVSASASPNETDRRRLWLRFHAAVESIWARKGEKQRLSDETDTKNIFQEIIWLDDQPPPPDVFKRAEEAIALTKAAKKNGDKPMAWFKAELRRRIGSLEEVSPC